MRIIALMLFVLLSTQMMAVSTISEANGETNGLGAGGTIYYTWGFMYRHHFANGLGLTTSIGGWVDRDDGYIGKEIGGLYTLAHHELNWSWLMNSSIRVYLAGYLANIYRKGQDYSYKSEVKGKVQWDIGLGAGPGLEFFFNRYFALHAELPWMTFVRATKNEVAFHNSYPHFGGGLIYYF